MTNQQYPSAATASHPYPPAESEHMMTTDGTWTDTRGDKHSDLFPPHLYETATYIDQIVNLRRLPDGPAGHRYEMTFRGSGTAQTDPETDFTHMPNGELADYVGALGHTFDYAGPDLEVYARPVTGLIYHMWPAAQAKAERAAAE